MATSDSVRESRYAAAITATAIAGFTVMLTGLTLLGVAASQRTTDELIGVLSGAPTQLDNALTHALDPWGVGTLITGVALTLIAAVAKIFGRQGVRSDDRTASRARSSADAEPTGALEIPTPARSNQLAIEDRRSTGS